MLLNPQNVENIFRECLYEKGESQTNLKVIEGITFKVAFHPERLEKNKEIISTLWDEIDLEEPIAFQEICYDKHGNLWTGLHRIMELLMLLGIATNKIGYMPRELWILNRDLPIIALKNIPKE